MSFNDKPIFDIKIIGGGIAGSSAGLPLARAGHTVTVYEQNESLSEFGAGLQLSTNATRILYAWNIQDRLVGVANTPETMTLRRYDDGSIIGESPNNPISKWKYGFPWWQVYRPDLQKLLADAAVEGGVRIESGTTVTKVDGEVGAGINSRSRSIGIPDGAAVEHIAYHEFCFRAVIPKTAMETYPETADLMRGQGDLVWMGPTTCVLGYTVAGGQKYNAFATCSRPSNAPLAAWNQPGDVKEARKLVKDLCTTVRILWDLVDETAKWTLGELPRLPKYSNDSGKFLLLGDAAHAIVPHLGQGGGQAIEDAAALAEFVGAATSKPHLAQLVTKFQDFREPRIENIRRMALGNAAMLTFKDGPVQEARDGALAGMTAKWKAGVAELGEGGIRNAIRPKAQPGGDMRSAEGQQYLYGYDVIADAKVFLRGL